MQLSNCHTHTTFCDGSDTMEEMLNAAISLSFESLGFSVHSPLPFKNEYALKSEKLPDYLKEVSRLKAKYQGKIDIVNGIELDRDSVGVDVSAFDYAIGSVHQLHFSGVGYPVDYSAEVLLDCAREEFDGSFLLLAKHYYSLVNSFICERKPQIVGHFDLIEKFNERGALFDNESKAYQSAALEVVDGICDCCSDIIFEVNTGAMFRCKRSSPYPQRFVLSRLFEREIPITITSDAHCVKALDFAFDEVAALCRSVGFKSCLVSTSRGFEERPL